MVFDALKTVLAFHRTRKRLVFCVGAVVIGVALVWSLVPGQPTERGEVDTLKSQDVQILKSIFDHELQNRAVGHTTTQKLVATASETEDGQFLLAFAALESFNQCVYAPFADKYQLSNQPGGRAKIVASVSTLLFKLPSAHYGKFVAQAAESHVERLRPLIDLAPEEDVSFFRYVVAQEVVQVEACTELAEGRAAQAAETLRDFIAEYATAAFHNCGRLTETNQ